MSENYVVAVREMREVESSDVNFDDALAVRSGRYKMKSNARRGPEESATARAASLFHDRKSPVVPSRWREHNGRYRGGFTIARGRACRRATRLVFLSRQVLSVRTRCMPN